jgi:hypothetical protein
LVIRQKLVDDNPAHSASRTLLALSHIELVTILLQTGKPGEAEAELRSALAISQGLADKNPADTMSRRDVA